MDTNHVAAWEGENQSLFTKLQSLPKNTLIFTSAVTLGEIYAGHEMTGGDAQRRHKVRQFLSIFVIPYAVSISANTESYYGQIIGRIWKSNPPPKPNIATDAHLVSLGVNINDAWIVASAWEHGLILLTADKMAVIKAVVPEVQWQNWI